MNSKMRIESICDSEEAKLFSDIVKAIDDVYHRTTGGIIPNYLVLEIVNADRPEHDKIGDKELGFKLTKMGLKRKEKWGGSSKGPGRALRIVTLKTLEALKQEYL